MTADGDRARAGKDWGVELLTPLAVPKEGRKIGYSADRKDGSAGNPPLREIVRCLGAALAPSGRIVRLTKIELQFAKTSGQVRDYAAAIVIETGRVLGSLGMKLLDQVFRFEALSRGLRRRVRRVCR